MKWKIINLIYDLFLFSYERQRWVFMKTNQEIAKEVFQGKWGNNSDRKRRLTEAGYNYEAIQSIVNAMAESMPLDKILDAAYEYDYQHKPYIVRGTETLEVEIDLDKYCSVKLNFRFSEGDTNG